MIKNIFKKIVVSILRLEAILVLKKYKPKIIGITGNVGKTSTKDALALVLSENLSIRASEKSYNSSDFGVALTILGCRSAWNDFFGWLEIMIFGLVLIIFRRPYPQWLILEIGLEYPGEIKKILKWVKPNIAIITLLPNVPVHVEFFQSKEEIINEKISLAKAVSTTGHIFLNADDENSLKFIPELTGDISTLGFSASADYQISEPVIFYEEHDNNLSVPAGLSFDLICHEKKLAVKVKGIVGQHQLYPVLAALAVGDKLGLKMTEMIKVLEQYQAPAGRLRLLSGIKETIILDDTYNASPSAVSAGLQALAQLTVSGRRIAVLGDMLQLGRYTMEAHQEIGYQAAKVCDLVVTVGLRAKFIAEALREKKYGERKMKHFDDSLTAGEYLQKIIKPGDLIFIKGSQGMRMEKAVEEIMAHPELKDKLLVRQEKEWQK